MKSEDVRNSTLTDPGLDDCVLRRLANWKFPETKGGIDVAVNYPFIFKSLGGKVKLVFAAIALFFSSTAWSADKSTPAPAPESSGRSGQRRCDQTKVLGSR